LNRDGNPNISLRRNEERNEKNVRDSVVCLHERVMCVARVGAYLFGAYEISNDFWLIFSLFRIRGY